MATKSYGKCKQCGRSESGGVRVILTDGLCGVCYLLSDKTEICKVCEKEKGVRVMRYGICWDCENK